jgi:hypothetical protein
VERVRQAGQRLAHSEEEQPRDHDTCGAPGQTQKAEERPPAPRRSLSELFQADRAQHAVVVFGDAFAAVELAAFRATRGGLARGVIEAALLGNVAHV